MRLLTLLFAGMSLGSVPLCGQTVDVHTHIIIPEYVEMLKAYGAELEETFPLPVWDAGRLIAFMDSAGIRTAPRLIRRESLLPHRWRCTNIRRRPPVPW